jgi:hypothetical protein
LFTLEGEESDDRPIGFYDGNFDVAPHCANAPRKIRMKIRADEIRVRRLQSGPEGNEIGPKLATRHKRHLHGGRTAIN